MLPWCTHALPGCPNCWGPGQAQRVQRVSMGPTEKASLTRALAVCFTDTVGATPWGKSMSPGEGLYSCHIATDFHLHRVFLIWGCCPAFPRQPCCSTPASARPRSGLLSGRVHRTPHLILRVQSWPCGGVVCVQLSRPACHALWAWPGTRGTREVPLKCVKGRVVPPC